MDVDYEAWKGLYEIMEPDSVEDERRRLIMAVNLYTLSQRAPWLMRLRETADTSWETILP